MGMAAGRGSKGGPRNSEGRRLRHSRWKLGSAGVAAGAARVYSGSGKLSLLDVLGGAGNFLTSLGGEGWQVDSRRKTRAIIACAVGSLGRGAPAGVVGSFRSCTLRRDAGGLSD